ncbi:TetR/AcrR family transcriptional regulator [Streptomyces sp. RFCAC02]|uniref:TetR/AcrR family transcriptional regulator n=1 Tax=Streptomyces sp. RFCAC02 TaxID=2499143 RepID=UPI00101F97DC|nr:TetR/AcrR family transcriptional regulator [Streptomyces sp. RFCAC02]
MHTTAGLRERKKAATRRAVHEATLRLSVEHGIDNVTVEAIADAVGISRRTFSNYFSDKEDALLFGDHVHSRTLLAALRERPADESAWTALRGAVTEVYAQGDHTVRDRDWVLRSRLALRHPSLLARQLAQRVTLEREVAEAITGRPGTADVRPDIIAASFLTALRLATAAWLRDEDPGDFGTVITAYLDQVARPFA